jgi:Fur family ferric uptake transcriptional regulator
MGYNTKQKESILELLCTFQNQHFTAADLGKKLEENGTPVGTATIYRFLEQLTEEGFIRKYTLDGKASACYQYMGNQAACKEHFHLKCLSCGTLFHVQCEFLDNVQSHILQHHHFQIDHTKTVLYGYCQNCQEKKQK